MVVLISALWVGLELLCNVVFHASFSKIKRGKTAAIASFLLVWALMAVYTNTGIDKMIKQGLSIAMLSAVTVYLYDGKWLKHVFLTILSYIFSAIIDTAIAYGASALLQVSLAELMWLKYTYIAIVTISKFLQVFFAWILLRLRTRNGPIGIQNKWFLLTLLFPSISVVMLIFNFFEHQDNKDVSFGTVIFSIVLAVGNCAILYIITALEKSTQKEREVLLLENQINLQSENYAALEENYSMQRKATHEFERHLQALHDLLERREYPTATDYLQKLRVNKQYRMFSINTHHPVVDVVLNQKYQKAQEIGAMMHIKVNNLERINIQTDSLVVLLANLLDNALEACEMVNGKREIHCNIIMEEHLFVSVRNTSNPVKIYNGIIVTNKSKKREHGYGLPAIRFILEQLHAEYAFDYSDGWFQFVAEIPI